MAIIHHMARFNCWNIFKTLPNHHGHYKRPSRPRILKYQVYQAGNHPVRSRWENEIISDMFPPHDSPTRTNLATCATLPFVLHAKAYMDLTEKFPYRLLCGNRYSIFFYDYNANCINAILIITCQTANLWDAFIKNIEEMIINRTKPDIYILDNEIS